MTSGLILHEKIIEENSSYDDYKLFNRQGFISDCIKANMPIVTTWIPSTVKLNCRHYTDVYGIPDILGIEELPTLFTDVKGMKKFRIFLIPYLITGYNIPPRLEQEH